VAEATAIDTSVVVAALLSWHARHPDALAELDALLGDGSRVLLPVPVLMESYSVMTRLPPGQRLSASDAHELLSRTFASSSELVSVEGRGAWQGLAQGMAANISGGATHDLHILLVARAHGATSILTFNERDFSRLPLEGIRLRVPGTR